MQQNSIFLTSKNGSTRIIHLILPLHCNIVPYVNHLMITKIVNHTTTLQYGRIWIVGVK
ncbi:MAG: hypothetical protein ACTSWC_09650 [Promethearchaeota archaeon]